MLNETSYVEARIASKLLFRDIRELIVVNLKMLIVRVFEPVATLGNGEVEVELPEKSGFSGPAGFFLDLLLGSIVEENGDVITISEDSLPKWEFSYDISGLGSGSSDTGNLALEISVHLEAEISKVVFHEIPPTAVEIFFYGKGNVTVKRPNNKFEKLVDLLGANFRVSGELEFNFTLMIGFTEKDIEPFRLNKFRFELNWYFDVEVDLFDLVEKLFPGAGGLGSVLKGLSGAGSFGIQIKPSARFYFDGDMFYGYNSTVRIYVLKVKVDVGAELRINVGFNVYVGKLGVVLGLGGEVGCDSAFISRGNQFFVVVGAKASLKYTLRLYGGRYRAISGV